MKKRVKVIAVCLLIGLGLSSCALFGERKKCPAYSQKTKKVENEIHS